MPARQTIQRELIINELRSMANHPTADEVYASIHEKHPTISKATVYRTLGRLADEGVILRVKINNGADHFDHQTFAHYHVRCTECGRVDDVEVPVLDGAEKAASRTSDYVITGYTLQFDGICPACQRAREAR
uniref:Fur family transcriptional regulator n=1 Tax=Parolsenella massiliensis TaxID=1871022 RepID=UPI000932F0EA|nr:transcriptional repressor [Parolsenella massiliensis]